MEKAILGERWMYGTRTVVQGLNLGGILLATEKHAKFFLLPTEEVFENRLEFVKGHEDYAEEVDMKALYEEPLILLLWDHFLPTTPIKFDNGPEVALVPLGSLVEERYVVLLERSQKQFWIAFDYEINRGFGEFNYRPIEKPYFPRNIKNNSLGVDCTWLEGSPHPPGSLGFNQLWDICVLEPGLDKHRWDPETGFGHGIF